MFETSYRVKILAACNQQNSLLTGEISCVAHSLLQKRTISVPAHDKTERVSLSHFPPTPVTNKHGEKLINQKRFRAHGKVRWVH
jgi:hypothetical protein